MKLFINDNICTRVDHFGFQIQGSCENVNCNQEYRRVCMKCILSHRLNDKDFKDDDIKYMDDLTTLFTMFEQENSQTLNNIFLQCNIQYVILLTEIIEFINEWSLRQKRLMRIQVELQQFERKQWSRLNIKDYFSDENSRQGIYKYLQNIEDQLMNLQNMMDFYMKYLGSNSKEFDETFKINHVENTIHNMFERTLQSLQDYLNNTIQRLFKNEQFEKIQQVDNKYVSVFEILLKQGYHLISDVPQKQFNQVLDQFSDKIKEHQNYYLQGTHIQIKKAYSLVYSPDSQKRLDESLELITRSIKLNKKYAKAQYLKGIIQYDKKEYDKSIETFKLCIQLDEKYLDAYNALGNTLTTKLGNSYRNSFRNSDMNSQKYWEAKNCYDQALQINPQFVKSLIGKADVLSAERQFKEANELYDKAIKLDPKNSKGYCGKGDFNLYDRNGIVSYALILGGNRHIQFSPQYNQKYSYRNTQGYSTQDQASKQLKMTHIYYNIGLSLYNLCKYAEAIDMFNMEIKIDPINISAYDEIGIKFQQLLGKSLYQLQKFKEALLVYEKIIKLAPTDMKGYIAKGEIFLQLEKPQEAKKVLEQFISIDPNNKIVQSRLQQI